MDPNYQFPASPGTPLFQVSPERVNQQRLDINHSPSLSLTSGRHTRESSVQEKAAKFDTLAFQSKALERKTNDAALKRAMLGREEAESEMRRYRDEARNLRKQLEEAGMRERKVGERLENVMENYGRTKETHAHTKEAWEKEIRRYRKESFKSQSAIVKLQEELKATRITLRSSQADVDNEKERSSKREQEAFAARYQLVGVQEELAAMAEKVKLVEQERDALKTIAKNEEIARIAAEGQIPLPSSRDDEEFASPRKASKELPKVEVLSSAASEEEIESLRWELRLERQRAERAWEHADFMQMECQLGCCSCRMSEKSGESFVHISAQAATETAPEEIFNASTSKHEAKSSLSEQNFDLPAPSTIYIPSEGIFRTVLPVPEESPWISPAKNPARPVPRDVHPPVYNLPTPRASVHARTPSCEPPSMANISDSNTSLMSMLEAPYHNSSDEDTIIRNPSPVEGAPETPESIQELPAADVTAPKHQVQPSQPLQTFHTISTTTTIPLRSFETPNLTPPTADSGVNPLSPTMTREEALAQIRERRGRARSLAQGTLTPRKQMIQGGARRDISAPAAAAPSTAPRERSKVGGMGGGISALGSRSASRGRNVVR